MTVLDSVGKEYRRLMDFQQGDIVCMEQGDREVVDVLVEGDQVTLMYIDRDRQKKLIGLCTREYIARKRA